MTSRGRIQTAAGVSCCLDIFQAETIRRAAIRRAAQAETIRRAAKIPAELRYGVKVRLLRGRRQIVDRHVLDHAAAKRADLSHRETSLSEGLGFENPQTAQTGANISGFVQSPESYKRDPVLVKRAIK